MARSSDVIVVGGGPAGLAAAGALARVGVHATVLEREARIGDGWRRRYDRLHLHTARAFSGLPHVGIPASAGRYVSRDAFADYLERYARELGLRVITGTTARRIARDGEAWSVATDADTWRARAVVLAVGQFGEPALPAWPGMAGFRGRVLHSSAFRNGHDHAGERVLVVGAGNSGCEIAADLVEGGAAAVDLAVRSGVFVVRRDLFGVPVQAIAMLLWWLPTRLADRIARTVSRVVNGDLTRYGLPPATDARMPFTGHQVPIIDVGFLTQLKAGRIRVRPDVRGCGPEGITFVDGSTVPYDTVVAATGFRCPLPGILDAPGTLDDQGRPRDGDGAATAFPGLYFIGYVRSPRGVLFETSRSARLMAPAIRHALAAAAAP